MSAAPIRGHDDRAQVPELAERLYTARPSVALLC